jgi:hypothetical protein
MITAKDQPDIQATLTALQQTFAKDPKKSARDPPKLGKA